MSLKVLPLSLSQLQVWLDQQSYPDSPHFNIGGIGWVEGNLNIPRFREALDIMVAESEALRLLPKSDSQQQLVDKWPQDSLSVIDFSHSDKAKQQILAHGKQLFCLPINLDGQQRPWQICLLKQNSHSYALIARFHHLIFDGYSVALAFRRWSAIYNALLQDQSHLQDKPGYQQFIEQSSDYTHSNAFEKDRQYWQDTISNMPSPLFSHHATPSKNNLAKAQHHYFDVSRGQYTEFQNYAKSLGATTFHLYIAALAIYLTRVYRTEEVIIGLPVLNRGGKRYKDTLGMFVGLIPFKVSLAGLTATSDLISQININLKRAYRHARYPLAEIGRHLNMISQGQDRLFDVVLSYEIQDFTVLLGDAPLTRIRQYFSPIARYPLSLSVCEFHDDEPVEVAIESSTDHFTPEQTIRLGQRLNHLMAEMVKTEDIALADLPVILPVEQFEQIHARHQDVPEHPNPQPYILAFEHQAALRPNACAVKTLGNAINYEDLNAQANRLADCLLQLGVTKGDIIAVILPRQIDTVMAFLATAKARAAFVPIDPTAPVERITQLLNNSQAKLAIVGQSTREWHNGLTITVVDVESDNAPQHNPLYSNTNLPDKPTDKDLVYLLFTSGSTGIPKGVLMEHGPLTRRLAWLGRTFHFSIKDTWLQSIQLTFDPAMLELFLPLSRGATLALAPSEQISPLELPGIAEKLEATCIIFVPSILRYFNQTAKNHPDLKLRAAVCGGEVLDRNLAMAFEQLTGAEIYNFYGPTEACIYATVHHFDSKNLDNPLPIGKPVDDTRIYILDEHQQPLPQGAVGELCIGGNGLARGYLNNPEANQQFMPDPFIAGKRIYRTGDSAFFDNNGNLHFVGRLDNQIKIRGQRIEPAEIESAISTLSFVKATAVKKLGEDIHAWVVFHNKEDKTLLAKLRKSLLAKLPGHMQPRDFTVLAALPQQPSGKTDYQQLEPDPAQSSAIGLTGRKKHGNDMEQLLLELWQEVLDSPNSHIESDFFAIGGNSVKALQLLEKLRSQIGQRLPLSILLHNPTPKMLANALIEKHHPVMVNLSQHESGTPIYLAASGHGDAVRLTNLAKSLGLDCHLYMLQPPELEGYSTYHTIGELAQYYADKIEQQVHQTPPIIAGFSVAGISALETARRLIGQGVSIGGLLMIDTTYPQRIFNRPMLWRLCRWMVNKLHIEHLSINNRTLGSLFNDPGLNGQIAAIKGYRPAPLSMPVEIIISSGFNRWYPLLFKPWLKLFGKYLTEYHINGFHGTLFNSENVAEVAKIFNKNQRNDRN